MDSEGWRAVRRRESAIQRGCTGSAGARDRLPLKPGRSFDSSWCGVFGAIDDKPEVAQQPVVQIVDPGVNGEVLAAAPGILHDRGLADMPRLFDDVEFAETPLTLGRLVDGRNGCRVPRPDVLYVAQPVVDQP